MNKEERKYLEKQMKHFKGQKVVIVEVGSFVGISSMAISKGVKEFCPGSLFYCVDIFSPEWYKKCSGISKYAFEDIERIFDKNMRKNPHVKIKKLSIEAAKDFKDESIDFIFIDADHRYEPVCADIQAWLPKLKKDCIMCGHDYSKKFPGLMKAVDEIFGKPNLPARSIWEIIKWGCARLRIK